MLFRIILFSFAMFLYGTSVNAAEKTIIVAGGCFWCVESYYEKYPGVIKAESGYINGTVPNPTYQQVAAKKTGYYEAVEITYDDSQVSIEQLVDYFWKTIDPTDPHGQFCDKGSPYKTGLFYQDDEQKQVFEQSLAALQKTKPFADAIVTEILPAETFYIAENYHQDYYKKRKFRYSYYRSACGRDARIEDLWGEVASEKYKK